MIRVKCTNPKCQQSLTVKDEFAGRMGKCPACGTAVQVPANGAAAATKPAAAAAQTQKPPPAKPAAAAPPPAVTPRLSLDDLPDDPGLVDDEPKKPANTPAPTREETVEEFEEVEEVAEEDDVIEGGAEVADDDDEVMEDAAEVADEEDSPRRSKNPTKAKKSSNDRDRDDDRGKRDKGSKRRADDDAGDADEIDADRGIEEKPSRGGDQSDWSKIVDDDAPSNVKGTGKRRDDEAEPDEEELDRPARKKARAQRDDDEDGEDKPRKRSRSDDADDDDDQPRGRKRRDDVDDDRPRDRRRRDDDDDDAKSDRDDDDRDRRKRRDDDDEDDRGRRRERDERDDDDRDRRRRRERDDDEDDDRPRKKKKPLALPETKTVVLISVAAFLVLLATINVWLPTSYVHSSVSGSGISSSDTSGWFAMTDMFEGIIIFIFALLLFLAMVALIILLFVFDRKIRDRLIDIVCPIAIGLSLCYVVWMLALFWIYFRMLSYSGGTSFGGVSSSVSFWPGPGTIMPPLLGLGAAGCLAVVVMQRRQQMWLGIAAGGGAFLGLILFAADGQPWANPPFLGLQAKTSSMSRTINISP